MEEKTKQVVLIVEDDEASYLYLESILKKTTAVVVHAVNGQHALDLCLSEKFAVVLMDLKMPGMDGFEATRRIKSLKADLPIIAITAYAMSGDEQRAINAGCDDYLAKPLKKEQLFKKLEFYGIWTI
jgi:two-component system cell cycle response regulator DivK